MFLLFVQKVNNKVKTKDMQKNNMSNQEKNL